MGFLVVDKPGLAADDSEFALSIVRWLRRLIRLSSGKMSRWKTRTKSPRTYPVCSHTDKKTFCRVVGFGIDTTAPAIGLSRVPQKKTKTTFHIILSMVPCACFFCTNVKKRKKITTTRTRTCSYSSNIM